MSGYRQDWEALLTELHTRSEAATAMGGEARIERQHARGRLTARERIAALVDEGSFREYGLLAAGHHPQGQPAIAADGLVGGVARLDGRPVVLLVEDFTVQGGSIGHPNAAKRARLVRLARENRHPLLLLLEGAGERASNQGERYPHAPGDLQLLADIQGAIPVVALVLGMSAGHGALAAMFADIVIMQQDSALFSAGPPLVKAAMGIDTTAEELGSAKMHTRDSGVAHLCCATETERVPAIFSRWSARRIPKRQRLARSPPRATATPCWTSFPRTSPAPTICARCLMSWPTQAVCWSCSRISAAR